MHYKLNNFFWKCKFVSYFTIWNFILYLSPGSTKQSISLFKIVIVIGVSEKDFEQLYSRSFIIILQTSQVAQCCDSGVSYAENSVNIGTKDLQAALNTA